MKETRYQRIAREQRERQEAVARLKRNVARYKARQAEQRTYPDPDGRDFDNLGEV